MPTGEGKTTSDVWLPSQRLGCYRIRNLFFWIRAVMHPLKRNITAIINNASIQIEEAESRPERDDGSFAPTKWNRCRRRQSKCLEKRLRLSAEGSRPC